MLPPAVPLARVVEPREPLEHPLPVGLGAARAPSSSHLHERRTRDSRRAETSADDAACRTALSTRLRHDPPGAASSRRDRLRPSPSSWSRPRRTADTGRRRRARPQRPASRRRRSDSRGDRGASTASRRASTGRSSTSALHPAAPRLRRSAASSAAVLGPAGGAGRPRCSRAAVASGAAQLVRGVCDELRCRARDGRQPVEHGVQRPASAPISSSRRRHGQPIPRSPAGGRCSAPWGAAPSTGRSARPRINQTPSARARVRSGDHHDGVRAGRASSTLRTSVTGTVATTVTGWPR